MSLTGLLVVVRGIPYLGATPLTAAQADAVAEEAVVPDVDLDDATGAADVRDSAVQPREGTEGAPTAAPW